MCRTIRQICLTLALVLTCTRAAGASDFRLDITGGRYPIVRGVTDVRNGTRLSVVIKKPWQPDAQQRLARGAPACEDDCMPAVDSELKFGITTVHNGSFSSGPFSFGGKPFRDGIYPLEIVVVPDNTISPEQIKAAMEASKRPLYSSEIRVAGNNAFEVRRPLPSATLDDSRLRWRDGYFDGGRFIKAQWKLFEADNGAVMAMDIKSIVSLSDGRAASAVVYIAEDELFRQGNLRAFNFDCRGYYSVTSGAGTSASTYAPPSSVAAQMVRFACTKNSSR